MVFFGGPEQGLQCNVVLIFPLLREPLLHAVTIPQKYDSGGTDERILLVILDQIKQLEVAPLDLRTPQDKRLQVICDKLILNPVDNRSLESWSGMAPS